MSFLSWNHEIRELHESKFLSCSSCVSWFLIWLFTAVVPGHAQPLTFSTLAGNPGQGSVDGGGNNARFNNPGGVAADGSGNLYVADTANQTIRKISPGGVVTTLAGSPGAVGSLDGFGSLARFNQPMGLAVDTSGNVYVADSANYTIRKITPAGLVSTLAGLAGASGTNDNVGNAARFYEPEGIAVDGGGNLYVADTWNHTIRMVTPGASVTTLAGLATVAGTNDGTGSGARFYQPQTVAVDSLTNLYVADTANHTIRKISPGGIVTTLAGSAGAAGSSDGNGTSAHFNSPQGVAVDTAGNVYVADYFNEAIRKITPAGGVTTLAGSHISFGSVDSVGASARFYGPQSLALIGTTIYVADSGNGTIRLVTGVGAVGTLAGSPSIGSADDAGSAARFFSPAGVAADVSGNIYVADSANGTVRKSNSSGDFTTLAGVPGAFGTNNGSGPSAQFFGLQGAAADSSGNVYIADTANHTIRKITPAGAVTTLAGAAGTNGTSDGTGQNARFNAPQALALDVSGNLFVADTGNHTIRKVTQAGVVTTVAGLPGLYGDLDSGSAGSGTNRARFRSPSGISVDSSGNLYVADSRNHSIRKVTSSGVVSTLAGLPGVWGSADGTNNGARFFNPIGIHWDGVTNLYVADSGNHTIRRLSSSGTNWVVTTVAGLAGSSGSTGGVGSAAQFSFPAGLAALNATTFYVADLANNSIRLGVLITNGAPAITSQPQSQTANSGANVTFGVGAVGSNPLAYQWRFNGTGISGATGSTYTRANVQSGDVGSYSVVVANASGNATSADASLSLIGPPIILTQPQDQSVLAGQSATFFVAASGTPPLSYQWRFNGNSIPAATNPSFTMAAATGADFGSYSVVVTNFGGFAISSNAVLGVLTITSWGDNSWGQTNPPGSALNVIAVAAGAWHNLALSADGAISAWGNDVNGQCDVPTVVNNLSSPAIAIAAGGYHSLAIQANGKVIAWGSDVYGQADVPANLANVIAIAAGSWHSLALQADGTLVGWGDNSFGQTNIPSGLSNVVAVAAGGNHSLALRSDGSVVGWGENTDQNGSFIGQSIAPWGLTNAIAVAAGDYHSLILLGDGTVLAWGDNSQAQCTVPPGLSNVVALAGGGAHTLALQKDGTISAWGANWNGQCALPATATNAFAVCAGEEHSIALLAGAIPNPVLLNPILQSGHFTAVAQTLNRKTYAFDYKLSATATNWSALSTNAGNGALRLLSDPAANGQQKFYRMRQW
ncbi:MAG: hypothetical protein C5B50_12815 [Verrucomicrobia bacterium]|nr:MAG: hypothetical protein C5B50_12815 [Verrucomicrobiota bacterium]